MPLPAPASRGENAHGNAVTTPCRFACLTLHLHYFHCGKVTIFIPFPQNKYFVILFWLCRMEKYEYYTWMDEFAHPCATAYPLS
jgi:hypothetical protein